MNSVFTYEREYGRGKGSTKNRFGPSVQLRHLRHGGRAKHTPDDIALNRLVHILEKKGFVPNERNDYRNIMRQGEHIRFMNMEVLAEVIDYAKTHVTSPEHIPTETEKTIIENRVIKLLPDRTSPKNKEIGDLDYEIMKLRMIATFYRYLIYYISIRYAEAVEELSESE